MGFTLQKGNGTASIRVEDSHLLSTVQLKLYEYGRHLHEYHGRIRQELIEPLGGRAVQHFSTIQNVARMMARSRELASRSFFDEAFLLLCVALESVLADEKNISGSVSRRAASILAVSEGVNFERAIVEVQNLYKLRSRFVHEGEPVRSASLPRIEEICRKVYYVAMRSQDASISQGPQTWNRRWTKLLDYVASCFQVGSSVEPDFLREIGFLTSVTYPNRSPASSEGSRAESS
jgi:Apea-like HEPN